MARRAARPASLVRGMVLLLGLAGQPLLAGGIHAATLTMQRARLAARHADLAPVFEVLRQRGIPDLTGMEDIARRYPARYERLCEDAAAQFFPWFGGKLQLPDGWRGERTSEGKAHRVDLGEHQSSRFFQATVVVHELAHAEFSYYEDNPGERRGRTERQHQLVLRLRQRLRDHGVWYWPPMQADGMVAYFIEAAVQAVAMNIEAIFTVERLRAWKIDSREEREALRGPDGRERIRLHEDSLVYREIVDDPPWARAGGAGDAFFQARPIEVGIPPEWRLDAFRDLLGLGLPETPEDYRRLVRDLRGPWAEEQRRQIREARDRRVEELDAATSASDLPSMDDLHLGAGSP